MIEADLAEEPSVVSHAGGDAAARILDAAIRAEEEIVGEDGASADYVARILRVPEIGVEALWLAPSGEGGRPRFHGLPASQSDLSGERFVAFARERATLYLDRLALAAGVERKP